MLIKAIRTGRRTFGAKEEERVTHASLGGVTLTVRDVDTWSSGEHAGDGEYIRCTFIEGPKVDPWPNLRAAS